MDLMRKQGFGMAAARVALCSPSQWRHGNQISLSLPALQPSGLWYASRTVDMPPWSIIGAIFCCAGPSINMSEQDGRC